VNKIIHFSLSLQRKIQSYRMANKSTISTVRLALAWYFIIEKIVLSFPI